MNPLMSNNTWELVDLPPGCKPIKCKFFLKGKEELMNLLKGTKSGWLPRVLPKSME